MTVFLAHTGAGALVWQGGVPPSGLPLIVMPAIDMAPATAAADRMLRLAGAESALLIIEDRARLGYIATANLACAALRPDIVAYVAQDALAGCGWLRQALYALNRYDKSVCALNDGIHRGKVAQFGVVRLAFAEAQYGPGRLFFPGYRRHRADEELGHLALAARRYIYNPHAMMMEVDYRPKREIDPEDTQLYFARKSGRAEGN